MSRLWTDNSTDRIWTDNSTDRVWTDNIPAMAQVATPTISPASGTYSINATISLSCTTDNNSIYYTTDGSTPTSSSTLYTSPINNFTGTLKVIAISDGYTDSEIATASYDIFRSSDWRDSRNLGAWDFTEQPDKWGYLNNPRWTDKAETVTWLTDMGMANRIPLDSSDHLPCGHWHKKDGSVSESESSIISVVGEWVAPLEQRETPYIYVYDLALYAIVRIDTSGTDPVADDYLVVNDATYDLDYLGTDTREAIRGAYCISKDTFETVWYCFRNTSNGNLRLVQIDVSGSNMRIIKTTEFTGTMSGYYFTDAAAVDDYAFFTTSKVSGRILKFDIAHTLTDKEFNYAATGASFDEEICSITINPNVDQICWMYVRAVPFATVKAPYSDYDFTIDITYSSTDGGADSALWQNFLRYDEKWDTIFRQRNYWPANGVAYYYSQWKQTIGRAYVQDLQYMKSYLGGNGVYFYVLMRNNVNTHSYLHRFTHQDSTAGGALAEQELDVSAYTERNPPSLQLQIDTSVYNEKSDKTFLLSFNSALQVNEIASFDSSLNLVSDVDLGIINYTDNSEVLPDQDIDNEPQVWLMPGETE